MRTFLKICLVREKCLRHSVEKIDEGTHCCLGFALIVFYYSTGIITLKQILGPFRIDSMILKKPPRMDPLQGKR